MPMAIYEQQPLRILTLDGGGYRGIASLVVLRSLLWNVDPSIKEGDHRPGDYFDLIGGTSTGGLIAIMLGRFGLTVQEAIDKYKSLGPTIFGKTGGVRDFLLRGARANTTDFEEALAKWMGADTLLDTEHSKPGHTPCFVTTVPSRMRSHATPTLLRSYTKPINAYDNSGRHQWLAREAARATSAALAYFEPMSVTEGPDVYHFKDAGASGFNNPTMVAVNEAHLNDLFRKRAHFCVVVSLGTGLEGLAKKSLKPTTRKVRWFSLAKKIGEVKDRINETVDDLVSAATNTENVHYDASFHLGLDSGYFRFDPNNGLGNFEIEDIFRGADLEQLTVEYLRAPETQRHLQACANKMKKVKLEVPRRVLQHASLFGGGYTNNFIKPIVKMVGELRETRYPATLCDPVPRTHVPPILGVIVVMPKAGDVRGYDPNSDAIQEVLREYGVEHLVLYGRSDMRTVYYAYNFIVDFPRTLNILSHPDDPTASGDTETFESTLIDNHRSTVLVTIVAWERFIEVMKYLKESHHDSKGLTWQQLEDLVFKTM